MDNERANEINH